MKCSGLEGARWPGAVVRLWSTALSCRERSRHDAAIGRPDGSVTDFGLRGERAVLTSGPPNVGNFYIDGESRSASRAFIAPLPGAFVRIPTLGGLANAALGSVSGPAVVGWSDATPSIRDAYLWSPEIGALRLHVSPVSGTSSVARAINAKWQIAGSRLVQGFSTAVVWTVTRQP